MRLLPQNKLLRKAIILFVFSLVLLIPLQFIISIVYERNDLYTSTSDKIGEEWGQPQTLAGPVVVIPYERTEVRSETITDEDGKKRTIDRRDVYVEFAIVLPEMLNAQIDLTDEVRNRGIYKSTVYTGKAKLSGNFDIDLTSLLPKNYKPLPQQAFVAFGISDTKALVKAAEFTIGTKNIALESGTRIDSLEGMTKGFSGQLNLNNGAQTNLSYSIELDFRGSNDISILPLGKDNKISVASTWASPSFYGLLPDKREISDAGFSSTWSVPHLVRNYQQAFRYKDFPNIKEVTLGVKLHDGVTHYRQVIRAVKYGYLFIALSILALFVFEIASGKQAHILQYSVVGASLVMFYLLLLSLAEHLTFLPAYLIASAAVVLPVSLYTMGILEEKRYAGGMFVILTALYLILFSILQMEDYALITGSVLVMCTIYALMYLTKKLKSTDGDTPDNHRTVEKNI